MPARRSEPTIAAVLLVGLGAILAWWGWKQGAYFGPVFYPGAICLFALAALFLLFVPLGFRVDGPVRVALCGIVGLAAWTLLSMLWSPVPASALKYAERVFAYAALFWFGIWVTRMLGRRMLLALAPVAVAGALVAIATTLVIATGSDVTWYLHGDATLRFPIGYRNADAAFFLIALWALLGIAAWSEWAWPLRAAAIAFGTMTIELAVLSQSRGSLPALAVALLVFLLLAPGRLRAAMVVALAAIPVAPAVPALLDVYQHGLANPAVVAPLHHAAQAVLWSTLLSFVVAAVALRLLYPRLHLGPARIRAISWVSAIAAIAVVVVGGAIFVSKHGGPVGFVDQRLDQFSAVGYPDLSSQGVRFGANVGSNRHDFWRVSLDEGLEKPLLGAGAGSFPIVYLQNKRSEESPQDPHSVEALAFSELGAPGLILLVVFVVAAAAAAVRSRRRGAQVGAALAAAGAAGGAQWFVHSSYDWFWQYPGVTALGLYMLGVAAAPGLEAAGLLPGSRSDGDGDGAANRGGGLARGAIAAAALILALVAAPLFLSDRYVRQAEAEAAGDPGQALADYDRAADLNPLANQPLVAKGALASSLGERRLALESFREAAERVPDDFAPHWYIARELAPVDRRAAVAALREARQLNPQGREVRELERELRP
jgi:hypothetical protein